MNNKYNFNKNVKYLSKKNYTKIWYYIYMKLYIKFCM